MCLNKKCPARLNSSLFQYESQQSIRKIKHFSHHVIHSKWSNRCFNQAITTPRDVHLSLYHRGTPSTWPRQDNPKTVLPRRLWATSTTWPTTQLSNRCHLKNQRHLSNWCHPKNPFLPHRRRSSRSVTSVPAPMICQYRVPSINQEGSKRDASQLPRAVSSVSRRAFYGRWFNGSVSKRPSWNGLSSQTSKNNHQNDNLCILSIHINFVYWTCFLLHIVIRIK